MFNNILYPRINIYSREAPREALKIYFPELLSIGGVDEEFEGGEGEGGEEGGEQLTFYTLTNTLFCSCICF